MILLLHKDKRRKLSRHFSSEEFECPCCGYALVDENLVRVCEAVRDIIQRPIHVNSGYRCPAHNAAKKGSKFSRHIMGVAADLDWATAEHDLASLSVRQYIQRLSWNEALYGIGWGKGFIHVDTDIGRKHLTEWTY